MHGLRPQALCARQAFEEISVYLRALSAARRRWGKDIARHEQQVRRCMQVEDQCRARLRRQMMRGTLQNLHWLAQTDLLRPAPHHPPRPPPLSLLQQYDIPAAQVTGFALFVLSCLQPNLDRVCVPPLVLLADMQSRWAVLPPCDKAVYESAAEAYRPQLAPPPTPATKSTRTQTAAARMAKAKSRRTAMPVTKGGKQQAATRRRVVVEEDTAAAAVRRDGAPEPKQSIEASTEKEEEELQMDHDVEGDRWEREAFRRFARLSLRQMRAALGAATAGASLQSREWVPIAQAEWATKSNQQKRSYVKECAEEDDDQDGDG